MKTDNSECLSHDVDKYKVLLSITFLATTGLALYFRWTHCTLPGLKIEAGHLYCLLFFCIGLTLAMLSDHRRSVTNKLMEQGQYHLVEKRLRDGLKWHRRFGPLSSDYVSHLTRLARVCRETRKLAESEDFAKQALEVWQTSEKETRHCELSMRHRRVSEFLLQEALFELATTQFELRRFKQAEVTLLRSIQHSTAAIEELKTEEELATNCPSIQSKQCAERNHIHASDAEFFLSKVYTKLGLTVEAANASDRAEKHIDQATEIRDRKLVTSKGIKPIGLLAGER